MVVLGGEFLLLLFIGVIMAAGCWSKLRGGCFWEVYNVLVMLKSIRNNLGLVAPGGWLLLEGLLIEVLQ